MKRIKPTIKIYEQGRYDLLATYKPVIKRELISLGNKIDYFFVNNKWPTEVN
jgi:hypothetical protein